MATQKLYAGAKLREIRTRLGLTQKDFAAKLGVSLPYLNQMENNNRPVSTTVVLALAQEFGLDVTELSTGDSERLVSDMREALADPVFADADPPLADLRLTASNAPALARAFLELHRAYRQTHERLASLDEALGREDSRSQSSPWDEVRDFFHYCDNYIDAVDRAAEKFAQGCAGAQELRQRALDHLDRDGIRVEMSDTEWLRRHDSEARVLRLSSRAAPETQIFQLLLQIALLRQNDLLEATLDFARFQSEEARDIAKIGLANYFAGEALMPLWRLSGRRAGHAPRSRASGQPVRRLDRAGGAPALHHAAARRQGHSVLFRARRSGRHDYQAPLGHAAAICPLWRGLPAVERAPCL